MTRTDEERKARLKEYNKTYNQKPENKAKRKVYASSPKRKARLKLSVLH